MKLDVDEWQGPLATVCASVVLNPDNYYTYEDCLAAIDEYCRLSGISMADLVRADLKLMHRPNDGIKISRETKKFVCIMDYQEAIDDIDTWE